MSNVDVVFLPKGFNLGFNSNVPCLRACPEPEVLLVNLVLAALFVDRLRLQLAAPLLVVIRVRGRLHLPGDGALGG